MIKYETKVQRDELTAHGLRVGHHDDQGLGLLMTDTFWCPVCAGDRKLAAHRPVQPTDVFCLAHAGFLSK